MKCAVCKKEINKPYKTVVGDLKICSRECLVKLIKEYLEEKREVA